MKELPILLNQEMVKAVQEDRKTQMRTPIKHNNLKPYDGVVSKRDFKTCEIHEFKDGYYAYLRKFKGVCIGKIEPPWQVGDRLYLQEPYEITGYSESTQRLMGIYLSDKKSFLFKL